MGIVISEVLKEFATTAGDERALIKSSGRLLEFSLTTDGAALVKAGAMDPFKLLPLVLMETHAEASVRNLMDKRLPHYRRQLHSVLEKVSADQLEKIRDDLDAMRAASGIQGREGQLSQELGREVRKRQSPSGPGQKTIDRKGGPELGR